MIKPLFYTSQITEDYRKNNKKHSMMNSMVWHSIIAYYGGSMDLKKMTV